MIPTYDTDNLPSDPAKWAEFRKHALTRMVRIDGPFVVDMPEGPAPCDDGWLAIDARGIPYPIAADEQSQIYRAETEPVT